MAVEWAMRDEDEEVPGFGLARAVEGPPLLLLLLWLPELLADDRELFFMELFVGVGDLPLPPLMTPRRSMRLMSSLCVSLGRPMIRWMYSLRFP